MESPTPDDQPIATHPAARATMLFTIRTHVGHRSLTSELLHRARVLKMDGATVFRAAEGYGHSGTVHRSHMVSEDVPIRVIVIDRPDRIASYLRDVDDLLHDVVVIVEDIEVVEV